MHILFFFSFSFSAKKKSCELSEIKENLNIIQISAFSVEFLFASQTLSHDSHPQGKGNQSTAKDDHPLPLLSQTQQGRELLNREER